jgi:addiction module HigA family antidote
MSEEAVHPGSFIKANVIPAGVSVTRAELIRVGRPALLNLLNGKAALSAEMAMRLEKAFGADSEQLLAMQRAYDQQESLRSEKEVAVRKYVPSFMDITARQISAWAEGIDARSRLAAAFEEARRPIP